jgi:hypothetical protein
MRPVAFCLALVALVSCARLPSVHDDAAAPVGVWYGSASMAGSDQRGDNIVVRDPDGTFVSWFRICEDDAGLRPVRPIVETGRWNYADGILSTSTLTVDGAAVPDEDYFRERYAVERGRDGSLILTSLKTPAPPGQRPVFFARRTDDPEFAVPADACTPGGDRASR